MTYAFTPAPRASAAIAGSSDLFPVRRIYCVGRNYEDHVREMGNDIREPPFFFMKPGDAIVADGATVPYPPATGDLHHEVELVVAIGRGGVDIPVDEALGHVWGYGAGNDLTRRDIQADAKKMKRPWDMAKGFDHSAPCGALSRVADVGHPKSGAIELRVNGEARQQGDLAQMIWSVAEIIAHLSGLVRLEPGDLIMTGTPAGVGAVRPGDEITITIDGLSSLVTRIADT